MGFGVSHSLLSVPVFLLAELVLLILMIPAYIKYKLTLLLYSQPGDILAEPTGAGLFAKFRRIPILEHGSTVWRNSSDFQIENHVKEHPVDAERESHLKEILQENLIPTFPSHIPPWIILLINTKEGNTVLLVVIHHSITDGVGSMNLFNQLLTDVPGAIPQRRTLGEVAPLSMIWEWATNFLLYSKILLAEPFTINEQSKAETKQKNCLAWSKSIQISKISLVSKGLRVTINSVISGAIWSAISCYVMLRGITAPEKKMRVEFPASLREGTDFLPGTNLGIISVEFSFNDQLSTEARIRHIAKSVNMRKTLSSTLFAHLWKMTTYITSVHQGALSRMEETLADFDSTCSIANIAGPQEKVQLVGPDVKRMIFIPTALDKSGLAFGISSYNGELTVSIFDYPGAVDAELLMRLLDEELKDLSNCYNNKIA